MHLVTGFCNISLFSFTKNVGLLSGLNMADENPDTELRNKIHHIIETMDRDQYAYVVLTKGYRAIVDRKYIPHIEPYRWHSVPAQAGSAYGRTGQIIRGQYVGLHNYVLSLYLHGKYDPSVTQVTFNNKLTLDCRLVNLMNNNSRQAAMRNRYGKSNTSSQFKGVRLIPRQNGKKWRVQIMDGKKTVHLGSYADEEYAAKVYDAAAWIIFGAAAHYNFPVGSPDKEQRIFASTYLERHFIRQRRRLLTKQDKVELGLDVSDDEKP